MKSFVRYVAGIFERAGELQIRQNGIVGFRQPAIILPIVGAFQPDVGSFKRILGIKISVSLSRDQGPRRIALVMAGSAIVRRLPLPHFGSQIVDRERNGSFNLRRFKTSSLG